MIVVFRSISISISIGAIVFCFGLFLARLLFLRFRHVGWFGRGDRVGSNRGGILIFIVRGMFLRVFARFFLFLRFAILLRLSGNRIRTLVVVAGGVLGVVLLFVFVHHGWLRDHTNQRCHLALNSIRFDSIRFRTRKTNRVRSLMVPTS